MTSDPQPADITHTLRVERTRQLYMGARRAEIANVLAGIGNVVGLWGVRPPSWLLGWLGAMLAVVAGQLLLQRAYRMGSTAESDPVAWERRFALLKTPVGLIWAALPLMTVPMAPAQEMLVGMTLLAIMTGAVGSVGASPSAFYGFVVPPILAAMSIFAMRGSMADSAIAGLLVVYLAYLAGEQRHAAQRMARDVIARLRNEELVRQVRVADAAAKRSLAEHQQLFDMASVGILHMRNGLIARVNPHFAQMLGYTQAQLDGQPTRNLCWRDNGGEHAVRALLEDGLGVSCEGDLELRRQDDRPLWVHLSSRLVDADDSSRGHIAVVSDITDRREREAAMQRLAHEDPLTGLPNRRLLQDRMQQAFMQAQRRGRMMAVLLVDLDGFKKINDNYGHEVGDDVLVCIAQRLTTCVRGSDTVSRLGGDEFVVLLNDPGRGEDAQIVAEKLIESISTPIRSGSRTLFLTASVGICMFPRDAQDAETMLRRADQAMYRAKQAGRGAWRLHREASGSAS